MLHHPKLKKTMKIRFGYIIKGTVIICLELKTFGASYEFVDVILIEQYVLKTIT